MTIDTGRDGSSAGGFAKLLCLLFLAGIAMRLTLLAVPPLIPLIHEELHMSETQIGLLIGLPLAVFAVAAVPGSLLIARIGSNLAVVVGVALAALAGAARGAAIDVWTLMPPRSLPAWALRSCSRPCRCWCANGCRRARGWHNRLFERYGDGRYRTAGGYASLCAAPRRRIVATSISYCGRCLPLPSRWCFFCLARNAATMPSTSPPACAADCGGRTGRIRWSGCLVLASAPTARRSSPPTHFLAIIWRAAARPICSDQRSARSTARRSSGCLC